MKKVSIIIYSIILIGLTSCGTLSKSNTFHPDDVRLNIQLADLEYLGQTDITATYRTYLGFIKVIDQVNGIDYNSYDAKIVSLDNNSLFGKSMLNKTMKKATYKVLEDFPTAVYFQVVRNTKEINRLFLGSEVTTKATIRAYKIK